MYLFKCKGQAIPTLPKRLMLVWCNVGGLLTYHLSRWRPHIRLGSPIRSDSV